MKEQDLPKSVSEFGTTKEEIFVTYETLKAEYGAEVDKFPHGRLGIYTYSDKIKVGLQQLMSGSRNMRLDTIGRCDLMALTRMLPRYRASRSSWTRTATRRCGSSRARFRCAAGVVERRTAWEGPSTAPPLRFRARFLAP